MTRLFRFLGSRPFVRDKSGVVAILTAILGAILIGLAGFAVDIGSIVYWQHRLQSATDFAALAATFDTGRAATIATEALAANGPKGALLDSTQVGNYTDDPSLSESARFTPGSGGDAVQLSTQYAVPLHFVRVFTGQATTTVHATATAYNLPLAGITIGTSMANTNIVDLNAYLDAVSTSTVQLTAAEQAALNATEISVFRLYNQIAARVGSQTMSIQSVMASSVGLQTLAEAAAQAMTAQYPTPSANEATAIATWTRIADQSDNSHPVPVSDVVSLNAHPDRAAQNLVSTETDPLGVPGLAVLTDYLHASQQDQLVTLGQTITVPGVATIAVEAILAKGTVGGGTAEAAVIGPVGSTIAASRSRVLLTITLLQPIQINLGLVNLSLPMTLPLILDIGSGNASVSSISCGSDILDTTDVAVSAQPDAVHLYLGTVDTAQLADFSTALAPQPAQIIDIGTVQVEATGQADIAQPSPQTLHFSNADIAAGTVKTVNGTSSIGNVLTQLGSDVTVKVTNAPVGVDALLTSTVQTTIATVLTAIQPQLTQILASLGLQVGTADVRATAARCGVPALVM